MNDEIYRKHHHQLIAQRLNAKIICQFSYLLYKNNNRIKPFRKQHV